MTRKWAVAGVLATLAFLVGGAALATAQNCSQCAVWNTPQKPFRIYGNTYYVGPHGLSAILIVSDGGDVLIDGDLSQSAPLIAANIRKLGFHLNDVKLIVTSHVHYDHAGGVAELQRLTGAKVVASPWSAAVLQSGTMARDDPQYGEVGSLPRVRDVANVNDEETLRTGSIAITAHFTPGHTPGGTSWSWQSCEGARCLNMVYADSLSAVAGVGWKFNAHPAVIASFQKSFAFLESAPCDIVLTPHPDASDFWQRTDGGKHGPAPDSRGCKALAADARKGVQQRLASEAGQASH